MSVAKSSRPIPTDLQTALLWIAEHEGTISTLWEEQQRLNKQVLDLLQVHNDRLAAIEKRVIYAAGFASGIGAIFGAAVATYMLK